MISDMINQDQRRQHRECACQNLVIGVSCYVCYDIKIDNFEARKARGDLSLRRKWKSCHRCRGRWGTKSHQAEVRVPGSRDPNRRCPSGLLPEDYCDINGCVQLWWSVNLADVNGKTLPHFVVSDWKEVWDGAYMRWCLSGGKPQSEVFEQRTSFLAFLDVHLGHFPVDKATLPPKMMMWILLLSLMF